MSKQPERKGLRFEVSTLSPGLDEGGVWLWTLVGAEGPICESVKEFDSEKEARSHIHANKGRLGNVRRAKVITILYSEGE